MSGETTSAGDGNEGRMPPSYVESADGTRIAYRARGQGPPLLLANGLTTSDHFWKYVGPLWARRYTVVTWDYKGHGDSEPAADLARTTIPDLVEDLGRVMDALVIEHAPVVGYSMGSQVALESVRGLPGRIDAVVCLLGPAGRLFDTALPPFTGKVVQKILQGMPDATAPTVMSGFGLGMRIPVAPWLGQLLGYLGRGCKPSDIAGVVRHIRQLDHATLRAIALHGGEHDASDLLPSFPVPLLIVAGESDPFAPARTVGIPMHRRCPGSRLYCMSHGTHTSLFEHPEELAHVVEDFLVEALTRDRAPATQADPKPDEP